ncbi:MAG TPA: phosphatase PAP2 family protein [Blastocatellia bacterium]
MAEDETNQTQIIEWPHRSAIRARRAEIVFGLSLVIYSVLAILAYRYSYFNWDLNFARFVQGIKFPGFETLMIWTSVPGNGLIPWVLVIATGTALIFARLRIEGIICMVGAGVGALVDRLMKATIDRPRPVDSLVRVLGDFHHESFPSGHVFFFVSFFGFLFFLTYTLLKKGLLRRILFVVFGMPLALIGLSRVYQGAHWPSDVVGAYFAGGVWLMLMAESYRRLKLRQETL